ncbi:MAG TPA: hypothetical protein DCZ95_13320 [Verrucomicrobia bacterium]|nr:MAG: hypothetical protein A2X46_11180 [Lentisphaerae bacterium GWF2_57_35]HBA85066.1 hypothetical protein [Verrucomicrobiota bacterium]
MNIVMRMVFVLGIAALCLAAGCRTHEHHSRAPVPSWIDYPKTSDSVFMYVIGAAADQPSGAIAREEAYKDALRQISRRILTEAGLGIDVLPADGVLTPLEGAEVMPDCTYIQPDGWSFAAWVQVSFPIAEKRKVVEELRGR